MNLYKYLENVAHVLNVSLAFFFCVWQLIISFGVLEEIETDPFYYLTLYLIILFITFFFFLFGKESWIERVKSFKIFFLTINLIFIAFLFFEV